MWYGYFFIGVLMVVCQAMELDGDKRAQLVQMLGMKLSGFFYLCIIINEMLLWLLRVDCILQEKWYYVVLCFSLGRIHGNRYGLMTRRR
jgi:hypothetical protein